MDMLIEHYFSTLSRLAASAETTRRDGVAMPLAQAFEECIVAARSAVTAGNKLMFIGNGGSAGIASHAAIDYTKNGGLPALAFNDGAALTCLGNDYGYEHVFSKQIEAYGRPNDMLVAISSSGRSPNILRAIDAARAKDCVVLTLSGFSADNPLRASGDVNFYVASDQYGFVELSHMALLHAMLDLAMGWRGEIYSGMPTMPIPFTTTSV